MVDVFDEISEKIYSFDQLALLSSLFRLGFLAFRNFAIQLRQNGSLN